MTLVRDRMSSPAITASPITPVSRILELLESHVVSAIPIVDNGLLIGIVSTTDIVPIVRRGRENELARDVRHVMQGPVLTVAPDAPIEEAGRRMGSGRVHRLVVVENDQVVGILSARDVLEEAKRLRVLTPISWAMTSPVVTVDIGDSIESAISRIDEAKVHTASS